jgi:hypothetical protein
MEINIQGEWRETYKENGDKHTRRMEGNIQGEWR